MPSKIPRHIVIVGGVAGGMSAATRARRLDESALITVFEKGPYVSYANCGIPYALGGIIQSEDALILQTPKSFKSRFNVEVHINNEVISIDPVKKLVEVRGPGEMSIRTHRYDKLILAQGADPFMPPMEGIKNPNVFTLQTLPDLQHIKAYIATHGVKSVAIVGGGFIGIEAADALSELGLKVSVIEYMPHIFPLLDGGIVEPLQTELRKKGVNLLLNARIQSLTPTFVVVAHGAPVPADLIIISVGTRPRTGLAKTAGLTIGKFGVTVNEHLQTSDPDIYAVGDLVEFPHLLTHTPANIALAGPANRQGRLAADNICGKASKWRGSVGTSVCKVFGLTVASTGFSVHTLEGMGRKDFQWVTVHPPSHAGYYPGASPVTLKLAFEKGGKILGAQAIGKEGVDKRIDVISTAIQGSMTVYDLEELELSYAPPYGSAKDVVNMAGFVAGNVLRGDVKIVHPEELTEEDLEKKIIIDVRGKGEVEKLGSLKGALNVPVDEIRDWVVANGGMIGKEKKSVLVYCQVGYRGYLAYRILEQNGFDVVNLDGGFKSVLEGGFGHLIESPLV